MASAQGHGRQPRDYLIPFPSSNGHGCRRRELSYDTASDMQNRVLRMVKIGDELLFCLSATRFWTPHSNRTFMPSSTAVCERFLGRLVSSSQRTTCAYSQPKESGTCSAQLSQNCRRTWSTHWQRQKLLFNLTDSSPSKVCRRRNVVDVPSCSKRVYEQKSRGHLTNSSAKKKNKSRQQHRNLLRSPHQCSRNPQHKGRLGEAFVCVVHRMSVLGKSPKDS